MSARRRIGRLAPLLLLLCALGGLGGWAIYSALGPTIPAASGATGACSPALSTLAGDHLSVPAGSSVTVTATCKTAAGPVAGRTVLLTQTGGNSSIAPASAVTDARGVARFTVSDSSVAGPITYTARDAQSGAAFDQIVQVRFVAGADSALPLATIGLLGIAALGGVALAFLQVRRRRRSAVEARVRRVR